MTILSHTNQCWARYLALCLLVLLVRPNRCRAEVATSYSEQVVVSTNGELEQPAKTLLVVDDETNDPSIDNNGNPAASLECGLWLAPSAIENAGLGMYAGRNYSEGDYFQEVGDLCIPIVDLREHNGQRRFEFLWGKYPSFH